ncbi:hypothetical protein ACOSQ2_017335 [Xanthoceras sorbifolium]
MAIKVASSSYYLCMKKIKESRLHVKTIASSRYRDQRRARPVLAASCSCAKKRKLIQQVSRPPTAIWGCAICLRAEEKIAPVCSARWERDHGSRLSARAG